MDLFISSFDVSGGYGSSDADKKKPASEQTNKADQEKPSRAHLDHRDNSGHILIM